MKTLSNYLVLFLGVTIQTGYITVSDAELAGIGYPLERLGTSLLDIFIRFLPEILMFVVPVAILLFFFNMFRK